MTETPDPKGYRSVPESAWQVDVEGIFVAHRWMVFHNSDTRRQIKSGELIGDIAMAGFPDVVAVKRGWLVALELKTESGKLKGRQPEVVREFMGVGGNVIAGVVRPHDIDLVIALAAHPEHFNPDGLDSE